MDLGSIPSEQLVLASTTLSAYIAYQSRINGLETDRERERYLNSRFEDATQFSDMWGITIDNIQVHEKSGFLYRLCKFFTGTISGESTVVIRYKNGSIPSSFWDSEVGKAMTDSYAIDVEHLGTQEHLDPTIARFNFGTIDGIEIMNFFRAVIDAEKEFRPDV